MKKAITFAVLLTVLFFGCDFKMLPAEREIINRYLTDLSFIPSPVKGLDALRQFDLHEFTGIITWLQDDGEFLSGAFQEGGKYTAELILTPKKGFTFVGFEETFIHRGSERITQEIYENYASVKIEFTRLPFTDPVNRYLNDLSFIPGPAKGIDPLRFIDMHEFTGTIAWVQEDGDFLLGTFQEGGKYTAELILTPKKGFTFVGFEETFIHRGSERITQVVNDSYSLINIEFARLPWSNTVHKYLTDLSFIPRPSRGIMPVFNADSVEYSGAITWSNSRGEYITGSFREGVGHTAEVYLTAKPGFTFAGFEGTFTHRDAQSITQIVTPNFATVYINFARLPFTDADFISITGTRLKTYLITPDNYFLEKPYPLLFKGNVTISGHTEPNIIDFGYIPLKAFRSPSDYNILVSGQIFTNFSTQQGATLPPFSNKTVNLADVIRAAITQEGGSVIYKTEPFFLDKEYFEQESFSSNSYNLPVTGYLADRNYFEYVTMTIPPYTILAAESRTISGITGNTHVNLYAEPFSDTVTLRQVSRDFYAYRSISVQFDPEIIIHGWNGSSIVDRFELNSETNTLTAFFRNYNARTTGEAFSFFIVAENGDVIRKAVTIGN